MIYSIGHGNKKIEDFILELKSFNISYLIDVRSKPYSRFHPQFNQSELRDSVEREQIKYVFMGDSLGGIPDDSTCYIKGKVDYNIIKDKPFFVDGLSRLVHAEKLEHYVAIMCSESNPEDCHRSKLIGKELSKMSISIMHIVKSGFAKTQPEVMVELTKGRGLVDLFGNETQFTSRKVFE